MLDAGACARPREARGCRGQGDGQGACPGRRGARGGTLFEGGGSRGRARGARGGGARLLVRAIDEVGGGALDAHAARAAGDARAAAEGWG